MKKIIISLLLIMLMTACATTQIKQRDLFPLITVDTIKANCEASGVWNIGIMGLSSHVIRYEKCLTIKPLLLIAVDTEAYVENINRASIDLLAMHYELFLDREDDTKSHSVKKLKEEYDKSDGWLIYYYTVKYKEKEKKE